MKKVLFTLLMLCSVCTTQAEKIEYGRQITYNGKVDASNQPNGKGKLITSYRPSSHLSIPDYHQDLLEGTFSNGVVKNAKLLLGRENGPVLWINKCSFKGTVEYEIDSSGRSVTYKMTEGVFKDANYRETVITPSSPLVVKRFPFSDHCDMQAEPFRVKKGMASTRNLDQLFFPVPVSLIGNVKYVYEMTTLKLNSNWIITESGSQASDGTTVEFEDGTTAVVSDNSVMILRKNTFTHINDEVSDGVLQSDNYYSYEQKTGKPLGFKNTYTDGYVVYDAQNTDDCMKGFIQYVEGNTYDGTFFANCLSEDSFASLYEKVMLSQSITDLELKPRTGLLNKNGVSTQLTDGFTPEQYVVEQQRLAEERAEKERIAAEEKKKKAEEEALMGPFNAKDPASVALLKKSAESGNGFSCVALAYMYFSGFGVTRNYAETLKYCNKTFSCTKNNHRYNYINSFGGDGYDVCASDGANVILGIMYYEGLGVSKNLAKAYECFKKGVTNNIFANTFVAARKSWKEILDANCKYDYLDDFKLSSKALLEYGILLQNRGDTDGALFLWNEAENSAEAMYKMGYYTEQMRWPINKALWPSERAQLARQYYRKAMQLGSTKAKQALARLGN